MLMVTECESAPSDALTSDDRDQGAMTDCFYIELPRDITLEEYIYAFYTSRLFKAERAVLSLIVGKPSTDEGARLLSQNKADTFSAWTVEIRNPDQILLQDFKGDTKSWLMVHPTSIDAMPATRLYFGSVVVPKKISKDGQASVSYIFHLFGGLHRLYSRALLRSAHNTLSKAVINKQ